MAVDSVGPRDNGFFTTDGKLKSEGTQGTSAQKNSKEAEGESNAKSEAADSSSRSPDRAFDSVRGRLGASVSRVNDALVSNQEKIAQATDLVKEERAALKELKKARQSGDQQEIEAQSKQIQDLQKKQQDLQSAIEEESRGKAPEQSLSVSLGNRQIGSFTVRKVDFQASKSADLSSSDSIDREISRLDSAESSLSKQEKDITEVRDTLKGTFRDASSEVNSLENTAQGAINSFEQASQTASSTADSIRQSGRQSLAAIGDITGEVLRNLVT